MLSENTLNAEDKSQHMSVRQGSQTKTKVSTVNVQPAEEAMKKCTQ